MKKNLLHAINLMFVPILFVMIIWGVKGLEPILNINFYEYGIVSWDTNQLIGIITFPLIHVDFSHLINNTYPILILGGIISVVYQTIANRVFFLSYLLSGIILWIIGSRDGTITVGASGVVYALASFILVSGFIKKQPRLAILSFLVIFLNFSNIFDIIPIEFGDGVSRIGHFSGFISGIMVAIIYRKQGPQPKKYLWEIEEELEKKEERSSVNYIYKKED